MPYTITMTTRRATARSTSGRELERHERAGTSLTAVRAAKSLGDLYAPPEPLPDEWVAPYAAWCAEHPTPPAEGGTATLDDGTTIEVRRTGWRELAKAAGIPNVAERGSVLADMRSDRIVNEFNESHA